MKKAPRGRSFASRNPTVIGAIGLVVIAVLLWAAFYADDAADHRRRHAYSADLLRVVRAGADDEVRIAGVKVGTVTAVSWTAPTAGRQVSFRVKNA